MNQQAAASLIAHGPTLAQCSAMSFDALLQFIRVPATINRVWTCLQPISTVPYRNPKVFVAAYLMVCHPAQTFNIVNEQEIELIQLANAFIVQLETIAANNVTDAQTMEAFGLTMNTFYTKYAAWRTVDLPRCLNAIKTGLERLYNVRRRLRAGSPLIAVINRHIARLGLRYLAVGGADRMAILETELAALE